MTPAPPVEVTDAAPPWMLAQFLRERDCRMTAENEREVERLCMRGEALGLIDLEGRILMPTGDEG